MITYARITLTFLLMCSVILLAFKTRSHCSRILFSIDTYFTLRVKLSWRWNGSVTSSWLHGFIVNYLCQLSSVTSCYMTILFTRCDDTRLCCMSFQLCLTYVRVTSSWFRVIQVMQFGFFSLGTSFHWEWVSQSEAGWVCGVNAA